MHNPMLQQAAASGSSYDDPGSSGSDSTLSLRVCSVFIIFVGALLGGLPPLLIKAFSNPDSAVARVVRAFSAGVILALALVSCLML